MEGQCTTVEVEMQVTGTMAAFLHILGKMAEEGSLSPQFDLPQVYSKFAL